MPLSHVAWLSFLSALATFAAGCDAHLSPEEQSRKDPLVQALSRVGQMYHLHHDARGVGPANWEELQTMAGDDQANLDAIQTVKDKGYDLTWGKRFADLTEGSMNTVMGQSSQGGPELMFDGSVRL